MPVDASATTRHEHAPTDLRSGGVATTITVTGGTGDHDDATGSAELFDQQITDEGNDDLITGTITFTIVMPQSG